MDQLLTTKLYIPQSNIDLVPRPRLYQRLDEGLSRRLTLICAPTGFGKSTLVTDWLARHEQPVAWLSLDPGDNDPVRFWTYLIAAVQKLHPGLGVEARQIVSAPGLRSTEPVAISLLNDISQLDSSLVMILDDYHVIEANQVHAGLSYLLEHQPPNFHIILITRVDPSISLARLRVHRQLVEIRAEDLQFTTQEADILFNENMDLHLKLEHIEALNAHTESWIVGLQLAAISLKGQHSYDSFIEEFTGGHQFILDYLTEEVLVTLPIELREFLLRTSIQERFCAASCQAVSGDPSSAQRLDEIRRKNLFLIPLDTDGHWFRYHHLFAEVLQALMQRDHPEEICALHLKAAAWFENQGHSGEAVEHALRSGDMVQARELVLKHGQPALHRGEMATVLRWLDALPEGIERDDPALSLARCWVLFLSWQISTIEPYLARANDAYNRLVDEGSLSDPQQAFIAAQLAMMRSVISRNRGDHAGAVAHAEHAVHLMPEEMLQGIGTAWNMLAAALSGAGDFEGAIQAFGRGIALAYDEGNLIGAYGCTYGQAMYLLIRGRLNEAEDLCRTTIERAVSEGQADFPAAGSLYITMARIEMERNHLDEAESYLDTGLRIARSGGFSEAVRAGRFLRAHIAAARGDHDAAATNIHDIERIVKAMDEPYLIGELNWEWARLCLTAGDLVAARQKMNILEEKAASTQHANLMHWHRWLAPRLLCAEGHCQAARNALDGSITQARATNSNGELIRLLALQAVIMEALGDRISARSVLKEALELGAPEGYIWLWLNTGAGIEPLLRSFRNEADLPQSLHPYLDSLLEACRLAFGKPVQAAPSGLPDPLTSRELEILRLICKGYSNTQIAAELVVTLNTVKKHTSNIYGKLGVLSRTQAIARAREVDLV